MIWPSIVGVLERDFRFSPFNVLDTIGLQTLGWQTLLTSSVAQPDSLENQDNSKLEWQTENRDDSRQKQFELFDNY